MGAGGELVLTEFKPAAQVAPRVSAEDKYDADGYLLLQENPGSATLYLPGEQLTAVTSGGTTTVTGARIIPLPSGGDVVRTGYSFEIPGRHGTNDLSLDSTAQTPAWRQFTPYDYAEDNPLTLSDPTGKDPIAEAITGYLKTHPSPSNKATSRTPNWEGPVNVVINWDGVPAAGYSLFTTHFWKAGRLM